MTKGAAKVRLAVAACLFLGWIGWLAYLVFKTHNPVILARPQFLVADLWVRGHLDGDGDRPETKLVIREVFWSRDMKDQELVNKPITVPDLALVGKDLGWSGPGDYWLPLQKNKGKNPGYRLTPLPPSPGFAPAFQLVNPGKKKDEVVDLIVQFTDLDLKTAKDKVEHAPSILKAPSPQDERLKFEKELTNLGATFNWRDERRIYHATPEALEQLKEIHMK